MNITKMNEFNYKGKRVLLRVDINSPIDSETKKIVNENRIQKSLSTIKYLLDQGAKLGIIAHQGDTLDYQNLISMKEHAEKLSEKLGINVKYIDDVCGSAAQQEVLKLKEGEALLLGNLRYLTEEISTFENAVKLKPKDMLNTYLVRSLAPLFDYYVNEAFSAAHRNAPSMVAFQELLPTAAGDLFFKEVEALDKVMRKPQKPCVFVLGGAKISDAFGMMKKVLENGSADKILTGGITGHIMLIAKGYSIGKGNMDFIKERSLDEFIAPAKEYIDKYGEKILYPIDLAYEENGARKEIDIESLPIEKPTMDIGGKTIEKYAEVIKNAGTIFVNGPAGVYESSIFEAGTKSMWQAIGSSKGYSVIGGGDTVSAAGKYVDISKINYVCTAGGAMVRYLSGVKMPLIIAMENAYKIRRCEKTITSHN